MPPRWHGNASKRTFRNDEAQLARSISQAETLENKFEKVVDTKLYLAKMTASSEVMLITKEERSLII